MSEAFIVNENKDNKSKVTINSKTASSLNILDKKLMCLCFGMRKCYVDINISDEIEDKVVFISKNSIEYLHLPSYLYYEIRVKENEIMLGPCIGILAWKEEESITERRLKRMLNYAVEYKSISGAIIVFALDSVDTENRLIKGHCYNPQNQLWEEGIFPYPSAIYRRIGLSDFWKNHFLTTIGDKMFNSYYFDKWEMYNWLSDDKLLKNHLPYTILYERNKDIINMLKKYKKILVKPISGMQGKRIFLISYENDKFYFYYRENDENKKVVLNSTKEVIEFSAQFFTFKKYIIQEYIDLLKYNDRVIDFRVIVQKNENNIWSCNGIVGRMGEKQSIVSNISSNGTASELSQLFKDVLQVSEEETFLIRKRIITFAISVCKAIDRCGINTGTVGVDVGVDVNNHLWLIEMNTRDPDPTIALDINDRLMFLKVKSAPLFYAKYLSGFNSKGGSYDVL